MPACLFESRITQISRIKFTTFIGVLLRGLRELRGSPTPLRPTTILHALGIDHERFVFKHQGRRYRLTDVHGKVVKDILA